MRSKEFIIERRKKRRRTKARSVYGWWGLNTAMPADAAGDADVSEDWRTAAAALGSAAAIGTVGYAGMKDVPSYPSASQSHTVSAPIRPAPAAPVEPKKQAAAWTPQDHMQFLSRVAQKSGIKGAELEHFLAQSSHETLGFRRMIERESGIKYDLSQDPRKAKRLGNTQVGDGEKFKGRGYIQLTGRYNYQKAGQVLGVDLISNPARAAEPELAAKIAVWYWKKRVQPRVSDWEKTSVKAVTRPINAGIKGLKSREAHLQKVRAQQPVKKESLAVKV
jgi:predicted chitinase